MKTFLVPYARTFAISFVVISYICLLGYVTALIANANVEAIYKSIRPILATNFAFSSFLALVNGADAIMNEIADREK
jgi:hypothetical protein